MSARRPVAVLIRRNAQLVVTSSRTILTSCSRAPPAPAAFATAHSNHLLCRPLHREMSTTTEDEDFITLDDGTLVTSSQVLF